MQSPRKSGLDEESKRQTSLVEDSAMRPGARKQWGKGHTNRKSNNQRASFIEMCNESPDVDPSKMGEPVVKEYDPEEY